MPAGPVDEMPPVRNHQFRPVAESYNPARCDSVKVTLRIAAVQAEASPGEVNRNIAKAVDFIQRASSEKVDVIVFPEAFVTGYDDAAFTGSLPASAELDWLDRVQEAVDVTGLLVILNTALDRGGRSTLTDIVLAPGRAPVLAYDKQHLYDSERRWFTAGDHGCSLSAGDLRLGLSVCYDANFPEHAAAAAFNGAVVYINSGAYFPRRRAPTRLALRRASTRQRHVRRFQRPHRRHSSVHRRIRRVQPAWTTYRSRSHRRGDGHS